MIRANAKRKTGKREPFLGYVLVLCEGKTEKAYFTQLKAMLKEGRHNYLQIESVDLRGGNARGVFESAKSFLDRNARKYRDYDKYIVIDCDAPDNIEDVLREIVSDGRLKMLLSNVAFETWLLAHFASTTNKRTKDKLKKALSKELCCEYEKGERLIHRFIDEERIRAAILRSKKQCAIYDANGMNPCQDIKDMNPYTNVHILVEEIMKHIN